MEPKWYAVYTKPCWEKKVARQLSNRRIENYCPLNRVVRQWSDRKKVVHEPLFTSYVFIRVTTKEFAEVRKETGVINFVHWLGQPAVIRDYEIDVIRAFLDKHQNVRLEKAEVDMNDTVRILRGPLAEYKGDVVEVKNSTVKVLLPSLGCIMAAEVHKANVEVIGKAALAPAKNYSPQFALR